MIKQAPIIIVIGPQGSGKGTQAALIARDYDMSSITAGDLFRNVAQENSDLGRRAKAVLDAGGLMPIDLWEAVVGSYLKRVDLTRGYLLDGVIRSMEQVDRFDQIVAAQSLSEPFVLSITLDEAVAIKRLLKRGRHDDTPEQIRVRLAWSQQEVQPVIDHFRKLGRLVEVDGDDTIDVVHQKIVVALTKVNALPKLAK